MVALSAPLVIGDAVKDDAFGGNFLFSKDDVGDAGSYDELANALGVDAIRYPGGSMTEYQFDMSDPDRSQAFNPETGLVEDVVPISEFMQYAEAEGKSVTIVLPTRHFLTSNTDSNGDRYADVDVVELTKFVQDVASGVYGDVTIDAFEIGNEYWGSGGMSAVEYGRVASEMTRYIDEAMDEIDGAHPDAANIDIVVQTGTNFMHSRLSDEYGHLSNTDDILAALQADYGISFPAESVYSATNMDWTDVNTRLIMNEFSDQEAGAVDGIATHIYTHGLDDTSQRDHSLVNIENTWLEENPDLDIYVTEWNQKSSLPGFDPNEDFGLKQAHEVINIMEEFAEHNVDAAHAWPLAQNTNNAYSPGYDFDFLTPSGAMFKMMNDELQGTRLLDFSGDGDKETDVDLGGATLHAFGSEDKLVLYVASTSDNSATHQVDVNALFAGAGSVEVSYLGVKDGQAPGSRLSEAEVEQATQNEINNDIFQNGVFQADLGPHEIMQIVVETPNWTSELQAFWDGSSEPAPGLDDIIPTTPNPEPEPDPDDEDAQGSFDDAGGMGGGVEMILLGLLPLLGLLGGF